MDFREFLKNNNVILDGGMGTILQSKGLSAGEYPELWNISHPNIITDIHREYLDAGSNVINTNTFGANLLKFSAQKLEEIVCSAVENARNAILASSGKHKMFVSLDIGPLGKLLKPLGDLDFERAVSIFAETVKLGVKYGVDLITIETMNDSYETKAALLAVKENSNLPVIVTNAYGSDGKLMTGASPRAMIALLEGMGADAIGANCSLGPRQLFDIAMEFVRYSSVPVIMKPNAGLPKLVDGKTVFDIDYHEFADIVSDMVRNGVRVVGGCCGTTPLYIKELSEKTSSLPCSVVSDKNITCVSSYTHCVEFGSSPILIGERINPTGKKRFKQALAEHDIDYILKEGISQQEKGVHILDVNVGLPEICEKDVLCEAVCELQAVLDLPLQIDTADAEAMEAAMRLYNGKPMVNSVSGKEESMNAIFPLVKKYGGLVVALTLDENGIPSDIDGRVAIARRILQRASEFGISKKDIIFDTLAMTVSADSSAALTTVGALSYIRNNLGCYTSLGVSNVSFGLPARDAINSIFFAIALANGLSTAIMNPYSVEMMKTYYSYMALTGRDINCEKYVDFTSNPENIKSQQIVATATKPSSIEETSSELQKAILRGRKEQAQILTCELIKSKTGLEIVNNEIIPALDNVGKGFENKTVFLPQLLMSAEAAKCSFEAIKESLPASSDNTSKGTIVIATVKGDIHDIGKNIVKLLLENYGYNVIDLGKDVGPDAVADAVVSSNASLCGLSALMTTTVPAMEATIKLIRVKAPWCKVMVGGAVLNKEYADMIGADAYCRDAMEAVRYADCIYK